MIQQKPHSFVWHLFFNVVPCCNNFVHKGWSCLCFFVGGQRSCKKMGEVSMCIHKMYGNQATDCVKKNQTGNEVGLLWANFVCIHFTAMFPLRPSSGQNPCFEAVWVNAKTGWTGAGGRALWGSHVCDATEVYRFFLVSRWQTHLEFAGSKKMTLQCENIWRLGTKQRTPMCVPLPETPLSFMVSIWRSLSEACLTEPKKERHFNSKMNQNDTKSQSLMFAMWFANNLHILAAFRLNGILASGQLNAKFATVICFCQLSIVFAARYGHIVHCNVCPPKVLAWKK